MKKKIFYSIVIILILSILLSGCGTPVEEVKASNSSMFIKIEGSTASNWIVVYHRETKVMYSVSNGYNNAGVFTLLVNSDGTPMLYEEIE